MVQKEKNEAKKPVKQINKDTIWQRWKHLFRLLAMITGMAKGETSLNLMITISSGLIPLLSVFALQQLVDAILLAVEQPDPYRQSVLLWTAIFILASFLVKLMRVYGGVLQHYVQEKIKEKVQQSIIHKAQKLALIEFENSTIYDQLQRVNQGLDQRLFSTMTFVFSIITGLVTVTSLLIYLAFIHWLIPLVLFLGGLIFTLVRIRIWTEKYIMERKQTTKHRKLQYLEGIMTEKRAAAEVRLFQLGDYLLQGWNQLNSLLREERVAIAKREYRYELVSTSGNSLTFGLVLSGIIYVGTLGMLSAGSYAAFIRSVLYFQEELTGLFWCIAIVNHDLRYIQDFFEYMDVAEEEKEHGIEIPRFQKEIQFINASFTYPGSKQPVLQKLNLTISAGEKIALVGDNGSGKTTLIKLLSGLYQPTEGAILVDGIDLKEAHLSSWRENITAIFQDFQKYSMTIQENIAVGDRHGLQDSQRIQKATQLSGAAAMIDNLEKGYQTLLGKEFGGEELSQGQWQKIAIARAYFRHSELLILDEPTASLDPKAEVEIYNQFKEISKGKTVLLISHRLGVAKLADTILVLQDGRIIEQGMHQQLIKKDTYYASMYKIQQQWYI